MSRKRPATEPPPTDETVDPLAKILHVLNETMTARRLLLEHSQSVQEVLHMADNLHRTLIGVHDNVCQRILVGTGEQASLQQITQALSAGGTSGILSGTGEGGGSIAHDLMASSSSSLLAIQGVIPTPPGLASAMLPPPPPRERPAGSTLAPAPSSSACQAAFFSAVAAPAGAASASCMPTSSEDDQSGALASGPPADAASELLFVPPRLSGLRATAAAAAAPGTGESASEPARAAGDDTPAP